jgi:triosephosphate isomerase
MHGSHAFIENWFTNFNQDKTSSHDVVVALPANYIVAFRDYGIVLSGQNVSAYESGAFTSQISAEMLKDSGADYCIIGHSEAREQLNESDESIREKFDQLKRMQITPIVCIGESLQLKEIEATNQFLEHQLGVLDAETENLIVAYEPIWAIGTGLVPTEKEIDEAIGCIRNVFNNPIKVLYGGSVKASNAKNLLDNTDINGLLVGGASLNPQEFAKIAQSC